MTRVYRLLFAFGFGASACSNTTSEARSGGGAGGIQAMSMSGSGGMTSTGGSASGTGGIAAGTGGAASGTGGAAGSANPGGSGGEGTAGAASASCDSPGLVWKTARKTWYTSYPDPGSPECIEYNGCTWAGSFAACNDKKPENWVQAHDIAAAFPDFEALELHDLCLKSGDSTLVVTVIDTCADSDCDGCCTQNQADAEQLIDLESYTNERWGVEDGEILWADLGPTASDGCD